jgi:hypothetical protein
MKVDLKKIILETEFSELILERCVEHSVSQPHFTIRIKRIDGKKLYVGCIETNELIELGKLLEKII